LKALEDEDLDRCLWLGDPLLPARLKALPLDPCIPCIEHPKREKGSEIFFLKAPRGPLLMSPTTPLPHHNERLIFLRSFSTVEVNFGC